MRQYAKRGHILSEVAEKSKLDPVYAPVFALEAELKQMPQTEIPTLHDFCEGLYARTVIVPKGAVVTGHVHAMANFFVIRAGSAVIYTPNGPDTFHAGHMGVSPAGHKIGGYALSEVIFTTFHPNPDNVQDLELILDKYTVQPTEEEVEQLMNEAKSLEDKSCQ